MVIKSIEIDEQKIEEAVRFAISRRFCLDELSRLLVMEGGVDLDTLSRIIRENLGSGAGVPISLPFGQHWERNGNAGKNGSESPSTNCTLSLYVIPGIIPVGTYAFGGLKRGCTVQL